MKLLSLLFIFICTAVSVSAQIMGNQYYNSDYNRKADANYYYSQVKNYSSTDSTLTIQCRILLNKSADKYTMTLSLRSRLD